MGGGGEETFSFSLPFDLLFDGEERGVVILFLLLVWFVGKGLLDWAGMDGGWRKAKQTIRSFYPLSVFCLFVFLYFFVSLSQTKILIIFLTQSKVSSPKYPKTTSKAH